MTGMNFDMAENVPLGTTVTFRVTAIRAEANDSSGPPVQGAGPWWMCQVTPLVTACASCDCKRPEGYFKASAHSLDLALALAVSRWHDFQILTAPTVERAASDVKTNTNRGQ